MAAGPINESKRLAEVRALDLDPTSPDAQLDTVCRLTADLFDVPVALVTLVDATTVWFKARHGVHEQSIPRREAFCNDTIQEETGEALVIHDLLESERYRKPLSTGGGSCARFYAGVPIAIGVGLHVGTLCVMDNVPRRDFGAKQVHQLQGFASLVETHLRLHKLQLDRDKDAQLYRLLAHNTTDAVMMADLDTTRRYVSPAATSVLGYDPGELIGTKPSDFVHPDDAEKLLYDLGEVISGRLQRGRNCHRSRRKDGTWVWLEASASLACDPATGVANGYVVSLRDISEQKKAEDALRVSQERLALVLDSGSDGSWEWDILSGEVDGSGQWSATLGYEKGDIEPCMDAWRILVHPDDVRSSSKALTDHMKGLTPRLESEYRVRTKDGSYLWTLARGKVVARDTQGWALRMVGTHTNITRRKEVERQLAHLARHDPLTGLPNRLVFRERLDDEMHTAQDGDYQFAVLACDLDGFKAVNDVLGHSAGDTFLTLIADRLKPVVRAGDMVARLGGDEFAIILGGVDHPSEAGVVARRVIEAIECPVELDGQNAGVGVSIGIAIGPRDGRDADQLFKNADIALYRAKAAGRNTLRFYEAGMDVQVAERNRLEQDMREAIRSGGFALVYQPIVLLASGAVNGFEALLRWDHPTRGVIAPADFIPIAEETGLIVALGEWALREACHEAASWPVDLRIAVNVSALQFQRSGLERTVLSALASSGLAAHRLELEITESVLIRDADTVVVCLQRLRAIGVRIALDDFGTGYSSLNYLKRFPFSKIKIDRSFIREIGDPDTAAIVRAVVGLAARVGAAVTAEGVETEEQLLRIRHEGCTEVQGFFFSRPLRVEEARRMASRPLGAVAA